jgi:hypothetical protein
MTSYSCLSTPYSVPYTNTNPDQGPPRKIVQPPPFSNSLFTSALFHLLIIRPFTYSIVF